MKPSTTSNQMKWALLAAFLGFGMAGCKSDSGRTPIDPGPPVDEPGPDIEPEEDAYPTTIMVGGVGGVYQAGDTVHARCLVLDQEGNPMDELSAAAQVGFSPAGLLTRNAEGEVVAAIVGTVEATCSLPRYGLYSPGENFLIVPGAPHNVVTEVVRTEVTAGEEVEATCAVFDYFGNEVTEYDAQIALSPQGEGMTTDGLVAVVEKSGLYAVSCDVAGASEVEEAFVRVNAALPASIAVSLRPDRNRFRIGDQSVMDTLVLDRFGNRVTGAQIQYDVIGGSASNQGNRFSFTNDGRFVLSANVTSALDADATEVRAELEVTVNSGGPSIECLRPGTTTVADAYMIDAAVGSNVAIPVRVADEFGVAEVRIAGVTATETSPGVFTATVPNASWGLNVAEVIAVDQDGVESSRVCARLVSDDWVGETALLDNSIALKLAQQAFGPGTPNQLTTINEILRVILNSPGLKQMIDAAIPSRLYSGGCGFTATVPNVDYVRGSLNFGAVTTAVNLRNGGLQLNLTIPNFSLRASACGAIACIGGSTVTARATSVTASINANLTLQGGRLRATMVGDPTVAINNINIDGSGFCGWLVGIISDIFSGTIRDEVTKVLRNMIRDEVGPMLDSLVSSLDINSIGDTFDVPRLDGSGTISLGFGIGMSSLSITENNRALIGIGSRFSVGTAAHSRTSLGVARRVGNVLLEPPTTASQPVGVALYEGVLNQVLHALWRGGMFQAEIPVSNGFARIDAMLPPVASITGSKAKIELGGLVLELGLPGFIDPANPLRIVANVRASLNVSIANDQLGFSNFAIEPNGLFLSFDDSIDATSRQIVEDVIGDVLEVILVSALNDGLPALPIPSFTLPASVSDYGLPANAQLGVTNPALTISGTHFRLMGGFGVR